MGKIIRYVIAGVLSTAALPVSQAEAATLVVDVAGAQSFAPFGDAQNSVQIFNIGAASRVTGLAYAVTITAFDPSYLSETSVGLTSSDGGAGLTLTPGGNDRNPGTASYTGSADLVVLGLDFMVGADGILRLEYFEDLDDVSVSPDARWTAGTLTLTYDEATGAVPEPATWAMMLVGFGLIGGGARYRRRAVKIAYA